MRLTASQGTEPQYEYVEVDGGNYKNVVSVAPETRPVACLRCHKTVLVLISDLHPTRFRHAEEQSACPEIQERKLHGEQILDLTACGALKRSLVTKFSSSEIEVVVYDGIGYVLHRTSVNSNPLYSPGQARAQADLLAAHGEQDLADRLRRAADEASQRGWPAWKSDLMDQFRRTAYAAERKKLDGGVAQERLRATTIFTVIFYVILLALAGYAGFLVRQPAQAPVQMSAQAPPEPSATARPASDASAATSSPERAPSAAVTAAPAPSQEAASPRPLSPPINEPEMVSLPGGTFVMGSNEDPSEKPAHQVTIKPFAISKFPITVRAWNECVAAKACAYVPKGKDDAPVTNLSWRDTQQFTAWLARVTQKAFRLPSEAEWEYAARGGTKTKYWWGDHFQVGMINCNGCNESYDADQPAPISGLKPNPFGLYGMGGSVSQWVADCWHKNYRGSPVDGSAWLDDNCAAHVIRSGSWRNVPAEIRPASREAYDTDIRYPTLGFRVVRSL